MVKRNFRPGKASAVSIAVKSALCLSLVPAIGLAQEPAAEDIEEITVTGSRIPNLDLQNVTPVQVYDQEFIQSTGADSMQEFLFHASFAGPGLFNENQTLSQTAGTASFDSRGFGDDYVVILLNGRRLPADPLGGDSATNLNLIPIAAVERIEYLSTGASAIYGADAVQGVINIITRQEYEGLNASVRYGDSGDGGKTTVSASGGVASDKGFATVSFEFQRQEAVSAEGLPLIGSAIAPDGTDGRSPTGLPGTYLDFTNGVAVPYPDCPQESLRTNSYGLSGPECSFDVGPLYEAVPGMDRFNLLVSGEYNFGERAAGYAEFRMSRNMTEVRNGAAPAFFFIAGADFLPELDAEFGTNFEDSAYLYIARRFVDAGPRATDNTNTAFSTVLGVRMDLSDDHKLDVSVQNVESEMNRVGVGGMLSTSALSQAVDDGIFDPRQTYTPQFYEENGISIATQRQAIGTENIGNATLSGTFGDSDIGYAVGAEYRTQDFFDRSDVASTTGDVAGGASSNGNGERDNKAVFGEVSYRPTEAVELRLAARWDDYNWEGLGTEAGDDAVTYMAGASWRPMDNLLLRASYGTGFKAPTLGELFLGRSFGFTRAVDTTTCNQAESDPNASPEDVALACRIQEIPSVSGGNPNLTTESSENYSFGFVWEPTDSWSVALDYYNIQVEDKIGSLTVQEILNNESEFPDLVTRINGSVACRNGCEVRSNNQNLFEENGEGVDLSTRYDWDFDPGTLVADLRTSYLMSHERQSSATQPLCDDAGTTSEPEWRINGQLGWQTEVWSTTLSARYIGETTDYPGGRDSAGFSCAANPSSPTVDADSYLELGLRGTYDFGDQTRLSLGIVNLTDEDPVYSPTAAGGWPFYDQSLYDPRGRRYYVSLDYTFF